MSIVDFAGLRLRARVIQAETEQLRADINHSKIATAVRAAARVAGVVPSAWDDCELAAEAAGFTVELGSFGFPGTDEQESERITSGDGRSPAEWVLAQREARPYWFGRTARPRGLFE